MKKLTRSLMLLAVTTLCSPQLWAQDKPNGESKPPVVVHPTALKIQIVFTEFEGDKKIKSMPYTSIFSSDAGRGPDAAKLRIGSRVPLYTGKDGGLQYIDVGTNLDCRADRFDDGRFGLRLSLERSWVEGDVRVPVDRSIAQPGGTSGEFKEPVIGQYKTDVYVMIRDGQTIESTVATDPLSGKVLKIELTLTVLK
jgi:hypothetical protein